MIQGVYVVKDDVAGTYNYFGHFVNDNVACRAFRTACHGEQVPAEDLSLYISCYFDTDLGIHTSGNNNDVMPKFLCRGEKNEI